jgi:hypothetical protein
VRRVSVAIDKAAGSCPAKAGGVASAVATMAAAAAVKAARWRMQAPSSGTRNSIVALPRAVS